MDAEKLKSLLASHTAWLKNEPGGERADLGWADLREAVLRKADLRGADLGGADLRGADLRGADLREAVLREADLGGADLREAVLRKADLGWAVLREADLGGADLRGADLREAVLSEADLGGADLRGATGIIAIGPGGSRGDMLYAVKHEAALMVKTGCFLGTLDEFSAAVEKTHGANPHGVYYRAVIALLRVWYQGVE